MVEGRWRSVRRSEGEGASVPFVRLSEDPERLRSVTREEEKVGGEQPPYGAGYGTPTIDSFAVLSSSMHWFCTAIFEKCSCRSSDFVTPA